MTGRNNSVDLKGMQKVEERGGVDSRLIATRLPRSTKNSLNFWSNSPRKIIWYEVFGLRWPQRNVIGSYLDSVAPWHEACSNCLLEFPSQFPGPLHWTRHPYSWSHLHLSTQKLIHLNQSPDSFVQGVWFGGVPEPQIRPPQALRSQKYSAKEAVLNPKIMYQCSRDN